jgi:hypothetical protein
MMPVLNLVKIYQVVQKLVGTQGHAGGQAGRQTGDLIGLTFIFKQSMLKRKWLPK